MSVMLHMPDEIHEVGKSDMALYTSVMLHMSDEIYGVRKLDTASYMSVMLNMQDKYTKCRMMRWNGI